MKYIFGERASGKTRACLELCRKEQAYLIVPTLRVKEVYQKLAEYEGYSDIISKIISLNDYLELKNNNKIKNKKFVIDEAGDLLVEFFGENLIGYSDTIWDYPKENYKHLRGLIAEQTRREYFDSKEVVFKPYYEWSD